MKTSIIIGLLVLSTLALASCSDTKTTVSKPTPTPTVTNTPDTTSAMTDMDSGSMDTMTDEMTHMGAASEEEFIVNMLPHHQEAIDTAKIIVAKTENAELKKIAQAIIAGQSAEVTTMQGWLASWYPTTMMKTEYTPMMRDLTQLTSHDLDDAFMEDMITHHEGAVHMAEEVLDVSQRPEIVTMAKNIIKAQNEEITIFKNLLSNH